MALIFLILVVVTGLLATTFNIDSNGFDYRTTIAPWIRGLFVFNIEPELMANVPVWFKIHILSSFALYVV
ncbi:respiratory nitrate reductase subunit gamma, partial [Salmonella enterica subsp. enterica serovar Typhimurium]|uniref:respiratory nitrate reductase subunit gamma n=1 Tax=Salmonella enterica TaxID=28901 RepID=UPI000CB92F61